MQLRASLRGWLASAALGCISFATLRRARRGPDRHEDRDGERRRKSAQHLAANEFARVLGEKSRAAGSRARSTSTTSSRAARARRSKAFSSAPSTSRRSARAPIGGIFEPAFLPLDLPFLWSSREHVWKVMEGPVGQELFKKMEAKGVKGLCWGGGWGFRHMLSNVRAVADAGRHEGPDGARAGIADLRSDDEGARRESGPDAVGRSLSGDEAGHGRRDGVAGRHRQCRTNSPR